MENEEAPKAPIADWRVHSQHQYYSWALQIAARAQADHPSADIRIISLPHDESPKPFIILWRTA